MAVVTTAVVGAGLTLNEARQGRKAAGEAAGLQAGAAREGQELVAEQFAETKAGLDPFITGGTAASQKQEALSGALGPEAQAAAFEEFQESPGTEFLREQGLRLVESGAGATGGLGGGDRLRELTKFSQGLALQDLNTQFGRLGNVAGRGLSAATAVGGAGAQSAAQQAGLISQAGAAEASGVLGQRQATAQGLQGLVSAVPTIAGAFGGGGGLTPPAPVSPVTQAGGFGLNVGQAIA